MKLEGTQKFSGVVLAGGRSTRMAKDKAFLELGGELLLARQIRLLREAGVAEVLISVRADRGYFGFDAKVVYDACPGLGPLGGLVASLKAASHPMLLVLAVDMPAMTAEILQKLISYCPGDLGCVPIGSGRLQPLAALYPRQMLALASSHLERDERSLQSLVRAGVANGFLRLMEIDTSDATHFGNWNRPEDLANLSI